MLVKFDFVVFKRVALVCFLIQRHKWYMSFAPDLNYIIIIRQGIYITAALQSRLLLLLVQSFYNYWVTVHTNHVVHYNLTSHVISVSLGYYYNTNFITKTLCCNCYCCWGQLFIQSLNKNVNGQYKNTNS